MNRAYAELDQKLKDVATVAGVATRYLQEMEADLRQGCLPRTFALRDALNAVEMLEKAYTEALEMRLEMDRKVLDVAEAILGRKLT